MTNYASDQIAAEAARDIFTRYLELKGMFREEDILPLIKSAIEKALKESGKWDVETWKNNFDLAVKKIQELESRAAHASEQGCKFIYVGAGASDTKRMDWLEKRFFRNVPATTKSIYFSTNGDLSLREAIDASQRTEKCLCVGDARMGCPIHDRK